MLILSLRDLLCEHCVLLSVVFLATFINLIISGFGYCPYQHPLSASEDLE